MFCGASVELKVMAHSVDWPSTLTIAHHTSVSDVIGCLIALDLQAAQIPAGKKKKLTTTDDHE